MRQEDIYVLAGLIAAVVLWLYFRLRRWWKGYPSRTLKFKATNADMGGEVADLLESSGYEVIGGKKRVPVTITVDGREELQSRIYIDYFVRKPETNELYAVKVAKERKPISWTGSGVRDALLPYYLLFDEVQGVLYVDMKDRSVRELEFEIED